MIDKIKNCIFRDVVNPNENSDGAITLRVCSLFTILYVVFLVVLILFARGSTLILWNVMFMGLFAYAFWLTYSDRTKNAVLCFNIAAIGFIVFNVVNIGWDSGIQHFIFVLILFDLIFSYMSRRTQIIVAVLMCFLRLNLYFYCRSHAKVIEITGFADVILQMITTVMVFTLLFICGRMLSKDSQAVERKLKKYNEELEKAANTDTLTKLWNRFYLLKYTEKRINESTDFMSIAIGDIDFFKKVNDTYGHECGDEVLRTLAGVFVKNMEGHGVVARWGGEEFIFLYEGVNGDEARIKLAQLQDAVKKVVVHHEGLELKITMTFGLVEYDPKLKLHENIKIADDRLYRGKQAGRDRIVY